MTEESLLGWAQERDTTSDGCSLVRHQTHKFSSQDGLVDDGRCNFEDGRVETGGMSWRVALRFLAMPSTVFDLSVIISINEVTIAQVFTQIQLPPRI
jgi:hypothetical protein